MHPTRRGFITASATALTASATGCIDSLSTADTPTERNTQTSFYFLYDLTQNIADNRMTIESIVPFGQHGHGWDGPTAGQQRDILTSDLFIYMGDGFQPWADDVVESIRSDSANVPIVRARDGVKLLEAASNQDEHRPDCSEDNELQDDHDEAHNHKPGEHDQHFWLDPRRTEQAVENIRNGMIAVDPNNETAYHENTDEYISDLTALHDEFDAALSNADKDAVLVAGHNAFRYLGNTYGFEIHALTGLSPDERISASARREAQEIIEKHDIEYVLHSALEPPSAAEQLVADTNAKGVLEITAISGVIDEWIEDDLGYIELMRTINLPAFTKALGAE